MNNLTERDLKAVFETSGAQCVDEQLWTTQKLYRFVRKVQ
jgi:hypothetical protein